jgi:hypothetical protein
MGSADKEVVSVVFVRFDAPLPSLPLFIEISSSWLGPKIHGHQTTTFADTNTEDRDNCYICSGSVTASMNRMIKRQKQLEPEAKILFHGTVS